MVSYLPLFSLLEEREISVAELRKNTGIAPNTMTKIRNNREVSMEILNRMCDFLNVQYSDIVLYLPENKEKQKRYVS